MRFLRRAGRRVGRLPGLRIRPIWRDAGRPVDLPDRCHGASHHGPGSRLVPRPPRGNGRSADGAQVGVACREFAWPLHRGGLLAVSPIPVVAILLGLTLACGGRCRRAWPGPATTVAPGVELFQSSDRSLVEAAGPVALLSFASIRARPARQRAFERRSHGRRACGRHCRASPGRRRRQRRVFQRQERRADGPA